MRSIRHVKAGIGVAVLAACLAGPAFGASKISYIATMGGDNHAADWKASTRTQYSGADEADGQYFQKTLPVPYAIKLKAEGVHSQPGHASDGFEIYGAANCVFNVELYKDSESGALATGATFYSTINNGTSGDPTANAAFAVSYLISGVYGRLIDTAAAGGPRMEPIFTYPTAQPGKLIGQGAGYKEWNRTGNTSVFTYAGVGMTTMPGSVAGLGVVPIAEGQIDMSTLEDGTYVLKVVPGAGNNVLRGDMNMLAATNRPAFAVASNETAGDTITFTIGSTAVCTEGITGRYVFYNNSAWDGNNAAANANDDNAIATDKQALMVGSTATTANFINYSKGLNGIMIDVCHLGSDPVLGDGDQDIWVWMGNSNGLQDWTPAPLPTVTIRRGQGANLSDRVVLTWPDYPATGSIPNSKWIWVGLYNVSGTVWPVEDQFLFGVAIGNADSNVVVNALDLSAIKSHYTLPNQAAVNNPYDIDRNKTVNALDISKSKASYNTPPTTALKLITPTW